MSNQENLKEIAYEAFVYAYPMLEQVKTINGMMKFMDLDFNEPVFNRTLPWETVGQPIVAPNLTSMTGGHPGRHDLWAGHHRNFKISLGFFLMINRISKNIFHTYGLYIRFC